MGEIVRANRPQPRVVVITGASGGIGRVTALELSKRGANVVLAARRRALLEGVASECRRSGVRALSLPTDVTDETSVQDVARLAVREFGRIDAWINNAAVGVYGDFEDVPPKDFRRVIETNFFGYVHGIRAVLPYFRRQRRGTIVNVVSVLGSFPIPHMSSYVAAKHAVRGLSDALRQELQGTGIRVCSVLPASIDTPFYSNAGNYTGRVVQPTPPVFDARSVAAKIVECVEGRRTVAFVPAFAVFLPVVEVVGRGATERVARLVTDHYQFSNQAAPHTAGNLYEPGAQSRQARARTRWDGSNGLLTALQSAAWAVARAYLAAMR
jgi:NAD(P)-dependent dehydrogenase (short-subunit alcohol dehydrogenase family)